MKFCAISDTHGLHEQLDIPDCDMIIHSGDMSNRGKVSEIEDFCEWYGKLPHKHKILIAGNHDWGFQTRNEECLQICKDNGITYLQDSHVIIDGIKIHGSPQTPEFHNWAFNCLRTLAEETNNTNGSDYRWVGRFWDMIPEDTDILLTHGPPYDILDLCQDGHVGCEILAKKIEESGIKYHIFGHIHEQRGTFFDGITRYINASSLDGRYNPRSEIAEVFEINKGK